MLARLQAILGRHPTLLLLGWAMAAATLWLLFQFLDPNRPGQLPSCVFTAATGIICPGCGTTRALHALAHGQILAALTLNPLIILTLPLLILGSIALLLPRDHPWSQTTRKILTPTLAWFWLTLLLTLWIWRLAME